MIDMTTASGTTELLDETGVRMDVSVSRLGDRPTIYDPDCHLDDSDTPYRVQKKYILGKGLNISKIYGTKSRCTGRFTASASLETMEYPPCWDWNASVDALSSCRFTNNTHEEHCVAVGYMQNAYIPQCYGEFALRDDCGSFLELHRSGDHTILSQTRLLAQYTSGFRTTTISLLYRSDASKVVCMGPYEIWWVTRTVSYSWILKKKRFQVVSPECDFDEAVDAYKDFSTLT